MIEEFWTDPRVAILTAGYGAGRRTILIAADIGGGCTKDMVIGKANRLGLRMTQQQRSTNLAQAMIGAMTGFLRTPIGKKFRARHTQRMQGYWSDPKWRARQCRKYREAAARRRRAA